MKSVPIDQAFTLACAWFAALNARAPLLAIGPLLPLVIDDFHMPFTIAGLLSGLPLLLMGATGLPTRPAGSSCSGSAWS